MGHRGAAFPSLSQPEPFIRPTADLLNVMVSPSYVQVRPLTAGMWLEMLNLMPTLVSPGLTR